MPRLRFGHLRQAINGAWISVERQWLVCDGFSRRKKAGARCEDRRGQARCRRKQYGRNQIGNEKRREDRNRISCDDIYRARSFANSRGEYACTGVDEPGQMSEKK